MASLELLQDASARLWHRSKRMFGGHGFFAPNGGMYAGIVDDDRIILKFADADARSDLVKLGGTPWTYEGSTKPMTMREWILVPDSFYDEPHELESWAQLAHRLVPAKQAKGAPGRKATSRMPTVTSKGTSQSKGSSAKKPASRPAVPSPKASGPARAAPVKKSKR